MEYLCFDEHYTLIVSKIFDRNGWAKKKQKLKEAKKAKIVVCQSVLEMNKEEKKTIPKLLQQTMPRASKFK